MQSSSRILAAGVALVCAVLVCVTLVSPAAAHHSFTAVYHMDTVTEIEGRITKVSWVNPHIKIYVTVGNGQIWEVEAGPVNLLQSRMGIEKSMLSIGETIRVRGNPGRLNARALWVSNIFLLRSKTELLATPGAQPYRAWAATKIVGNSGVLTGPGDRPAGAARSFFRTWEPLLNTFPRPRGEPVLTEAGRRAQARYTKQAIADCEVPGMPFAMMSPYAIEIVPQGDRLLIRGEAYDLTRVVHRTAPTSPPAPSPLGLSVVSRIDSDELVVQTSRINYHSYGDLGPAQSNQSQIVERFTLSADGLKLDYEITVTDPVMLGKPWSWGGSFFATKAAAIRPWTCGVERG